MEIRIPVAGGEIWAEDSGNGTPLILIHPAEATRTSGHHCWLHQYSNRTYDLRLEYQAAGTAWSVTTTAGYGPSPAPAGTFTKLADLQTVLDHLRISRATLVAHSGGGGTALALALTSPQRVSSLVLVAPGCMDYPWPEDDPFLTGFDSLYLAGDRDGLVELGLRTWAPAEPSASGPDRGGATFR